MLEYLIKNQDKLFIALIEHFNIVVLSLILSLFIASILTIICMYSKMISKLIINLFSMIYSIPSLALFALFIPLTGLGLTTAILVLTIYNQYLLLHNFIVGLNEVNPAIIEAANGMGMTNMQVFFKVRLPLSKKALFAGIRIAVVSTIGIATIAASINAGGLGTILFDGLRTMNINKIVLGCILSAGLAIIANGLLNYIENRFKNQYAEGIK
jgi:osmoprotectant transport system permease protein